MYKYKHNALWSTSEAILIPFK